MNIQKQFLKTEWNDVIRKGYAIAVLFLCLSCIVIRAHYSAITLDEAHTYISYVTEFRFENIQGFLENYDGRANNHLLNTALMWLTDRISGIHYDEFMVRFPNVCFGFCFCFFCFILYRKKEISTFLFSMLMLNEFLNGAFALGRGYGMAACLAMAAVYFVKKYVESDYTEYKFLSIAILFFTLAESANTVVLLLTASTALLLFVIMLRKKVLLPYLKRAWFFLIPMAACNFLLLAYHMYVSADGEGKALASYHGNPVEGIIGCFAEMYTGRFAGIATWLLVLLIISAAVYGIFQKKKLLFTYLFLIYFVLCSAMAVVLGKGMPSGYALLPACPMIVFAIGEALRLLWGDIIGVYCTRWSRGLGILFSVGCSCLFLLHFVRTIDFDINNDLRTKLYDSVMGSYKNSLDSEELHWLHTPFYQKQFLYRYGYDIYLEEYTIETMSLGETLRMLTNSKFNALIEIDDRAVFNQYAYELKELGIDIKDLPEATDYILLRRDGEQNMEYIYDFKGSDHTQDTIMGVMSLYNGENGSYGVYMDGIECLTVKLEEMQPVAAICVWQNGEEEPMDYKVYEK